MSRVTRLVWIATLSLLSLAALDAGTASAHIAVPPAPKVVSAWAGSSSSGSFSPQHVAVVQGQQVEWTFGGVAKISATDSSGMGLFNSGARGASSSNYLFTFEGAGTYPYDSTTPVKATGSVGVSLRRSPASGSTATTFSIGVAGKVRSGFVEDVEIHAPGGTWKWWHYGVTGTSVSFKTTTTGWWMFRSRLRRTSNNKFSSFSPNVLLDVK